jgi:hypothetical protein
VRANPKVSNALISLSAAVLLFGAMAGATRLWIPDGLSLFPAFRYWILLAAVLAGAAFFRNGGRLTGVRITPYHFSFVLVAVFVSDFLCRNYSFLRGPSIRGTIIVAALAAALFMLKNARAWVNWLAVIAPIVLFAEFLLASQGRIR